MNYKITLVLFLIVTIVVVSSCMPGSHSRWVVKDRPAGFFAGLWHGIIAFFTLILSIFTKVTMYESYNTGFWYDLGFYLGAAGCFGGGTTVIYKKR